MKIPKSLLAAMMAGMVVGATTSCEKVNIRKDLETDNSHESCPEPTLEAGGEEPQPFPDNCMLCGLG